MLRIPQRHSLTSQTAAILADQIAEGTWSTWLPGERALCDMLQVSRYTLRAALRQLQSKGAITAEHGTGNRILGGPRSGRKKPLASQDVGLLLPGPLEQLRPSQVSWIDELRALLGERGCRLHLFHGKKYAQRDPTRALQNLLKQHAHRCWVLVLSPEVVQRWFQKQKIPCVVAGSIYGGIDLPFCDLNHHATCRHAAGVLLSRGHLRLALMVEKTRRAGDLESEVGFSEAVRQSAKPGSEIVVAYNDGTPENIASSVRRVMQRTPPPTALVVLNSFHYLTVVTSLTHLGYAVPEDVSVVSRDGEVSFPYLIPRPVHYKTNPRIFAKNLLTQVLQLLEGQLVTRRKSQMIPEFIPGKSVSAPAQRN